ncbi:hypothetical protein J8J04_00430 ['Fragaria x ananassa' phyllody phytoplasma]|uniref:Uncharacterized protein n=1 Tax='Fragaria x ananassa' phyllody phytoplasma TaxID=2358428 RepID=A0ABS5K2S3_9MOLU|nr:hypothetical protein ['Fragaria x ananassa' phyllody phytoplasma]MBS2126188.1 hypothetical protein ['Fragaria x ananassa' phyllody phytoplasma]
MFVIFEKELDQNGKKIDEDKTFCRTYLLNIFLVYYFVYQHIFFYSNKL